MHISTFSHLRQSAPGFWKLWVADRLLRQMALAVLPVKFCRLPTASAPTGFTGALEAMHPEDTMIPQPHRPQEKELLNFSLSPLFFSEATLTEMFYLSHYSNINNVLAQRCVCIVFVASLRERVVIRNLPKLGLKRSFLEIWQITSTAFRGLSWRAESHCLTQWLYISL